MGRWKPSEALLLTGLAVRPYLTPAAVEASVPEKYKVANLLAGGKILRSNRTTAQFARKRRLGVGPMCRVRLLQLKEVIGRVPQPRLLGPGMAPNLTRQRHEACMALLPHGENEKSPGLKARSGLFCLRVAWRTAPPLFISAACGQSSRPNRPAPGRPLPRRWGYR